MTFGYNADVAFGNTTSDIIDHAKDLLSCLVDKREEDDVGRWYLMDPGDTTAEILLRKCGNQ
jgi:hypothetical protein